MTILTHHDILVRHVRKTDRGQVQANASRETTMRAFFRAAVTLMLGAAVLAAILALKTAIYLPHFNS